MAVLAGEDGLLTKAGPGCYRGAAAEIGAPDEQKSGKWAKVMELSQRSESMFCQRLVVVAALVASTWAAAQEGVGDKQVLVGQFAAFSGPAAQLGQRMQV